jgi:hypothetical protein
VTFKLFILSGNMQHPEYTFDTDDVQVPLIAIRGAIDEGYLGRKEKSAFSTNDIHILLKLGPGTILRLIEEKSAQGVAAEQRVRSVHLQHGLITPALVKTKPYSLVIQYGVQQVEPDLEFETIEDAQESVDLAFDRGYLEHAIVEGSDHIFLIPMAGQVFMIMTKDDAEARRRMLVEMRMREAAQKSRSGLIVKS